MSHPSVNCAHQLPSMGANKPLLEERCHAVTEWWLFLFFGDHTKRATNGRPYEQRLFRFFISEVLFNSKGRPMVAPTNNIFLNYRPPKKATGGRPYNINHFS